MPLAAEDEYLIFLVSDFEQKAIVILNRKFTGEISIKLPDFFNNNIIKDAVNGKSILIENNLFRI